MIRFPDLRKVNWQLPGFTSRLLIKWWMILRVVVVTTTMAVVWYFSLRGNSFSAGIVLPASVTAITVFVSSLLYLAVKRGKQFELHYFLQYFFDVALISLISLITLPFNVNFIPLYVLIIAIASILSFRAGAFFCATIASISYLPVGLRVVDLGLRVTDIFQFNVRYLADRWVWLNVLMQVFIFYSIAFITSYLSLKLRTTGSELEDTRRLLRQHRLDTDEILQTIASGLLICNSDGQVVYLNAAGERLLGMKSRHVLERRVGDIFSECCPDISLIIDMAIGPQVVVNHRIAEMKRWEAKVPLAVSSSVMRGHDGGLRGVSVIFEDVTMETRARELELRSSKLAAVAELSASLAHEIKNPLASIRSAVELLGDRLAGSRNAGTGKLISCVLTESDRLTELLRQFLQFSSDTSGPAQNIGLGELFQEVIDAVRYHPEWREQIEIDVDSDVAKKIVLVHRGSLSQVFYNLLINAAQVKGEDGRQASRVTVTSADRRRANGNEDTRASCYRLQISDDGPGIDRTLREKIFEPFFSTRKGGFGLGLAVVHRLVASMGGVIYTDAPPQGYGAVFIISLPRADDGEVEEKKSSRQVSRKPAADGVRKTGAANR